MRPRHRLNHRETRPDRLAPHESADCTANEWWRTESDPDGNHRRPKASKETVNGVRRPRRDHYPEWFIDTLREIDVTMPEPPRGPGKE